MKIRGITASKMADRMMMMMMMMIIITTTIR
jgi:hypothetical protein